MEPFYTTVDAQSLQRERDKARELRGSAWWKNQLGRGRCFYCHRRVPPRELTMDHKTPIVRGGKTTRHNVVPCCKQCNSEKKYLLMEEFIRFRAEEGRALACAEHGLS